MLPLELLLFTSAAIAAPIARRSPSGPAISTNFQDPSVIYLESTSTFHAFSAPNGNTAGTSSNVITATSSDFSSWTVSTRDALPDPGSWAASPPHVWAPDVVQLPNGNFILYYAATTSTDTSKHCIGAAISTTPDGPYSPLSTPIYCDLTIGGAIDADGFRDPITSRQYIVYKVDGNSIGHGGSCKNTVAPILSTPIILQEVDPNDGINSISNPITLLTNDPSTDGPVIEAPTLAYDTASSTYILFFTSGCFTTSAYNIQYATASNIAGPYTRQGAFLKTGDTSADVQLPGSPDVEPNTNQFIFHGDLNKGWFNGDGSLRVRGLYASAVSWGTQPVALQKLM